jgi:hypothetical protein
MLLNSSTQPLSHCTTLPYPTLHCTLLNTGAIQVNGNNNELN